MLKIDCLKMKEDIKNILIAVSQSSGRPLKHLAIIYEESTNSIDIVDVIIRDKIIEIESIWKEISKKYVTNLEIQKM